jgi:hypothetical protein
MFSAGRSWCCHEHKPSDGREVCRSSSISTGRKWRLVVKDHQLAGDAVETRWATTDAKSGARLTPREIRSYRPALPRPSVEMMPRYDRFFVAGPAPGTSVQRLSQQTGSLPHPAELAAGGRTFALLSDRLSIWPGLRPRGGCAFVAEAHSSQRFASLRTPPTW